LTWCVGRRGGWECEGAYFPHRNIQAAEPTPSTRVLPPVLALRWHVKDRHVKDTAQDVAEGMVQSAAADVLGAAEDGSMKVFIAARVIFQRRNPRPPTHACRPPRCPWATLEGRARKGRGAGRG